MIKEHEQFVIDNGEKFGKMLKEKYGYEKTQLDFKLGFHNGKFIAIEQNTKVFIRLGRY